MVKPLKKNKRKEAREFRLCYLWGRKGAPSEATLSGGGSGAPDLFTCLPGARSAGLTPWLRRLVFSCNKKADHCSVHDCS